MEDDDEQLSASTTVCSIAYKGKNGHSCKVQAKQTLSGDPGAVDVLGPEDGILPLKISVRIGDKRVKREVLRGSGILQLLKSFFRQVWLSCT